MKNIKIAVMSFIIVWSLQAGEIFGTLTGKDGTPAKNQKMTLEYENMVKDTTFSDEDGYYSLFLENTGECIISTVYKSDTLSIPAYAFSNESEYNLKIVKTPEGSLILKRK